MIAAAAVDPYKLKKTVADNNEKIGEFVLGVGTWVGAWRQLKGGGAW